MENYINGLASLGHSPKVQSSKAIPPKKRQTPLTRNPFSAQTPTPAKRKLESPMHPSLKSNKRHTPSNRKPFTPIPAIPAKTPCYTPHYSPQFSDEEVFFDKTPSSVKTPPSQPKRELEELEGTACIGINAPLQLEGTVQPKRLLLTDYDFDTDIA